MKRRRVILRADASHDIGFGHLARLCALIEELEANDHEPILMFGGDRAAVTGWLVDRGIRTEIHPWTPAQVAQSAHDLGASAVVIDGGPIAHDCIPLLAKLPWLHTVLVDDHGGFPLPIHTVINHNFHAPSLAPSYVARHMLLGRRYAMLRKDIRRLTRGSCRPYPGARLRVVVTFGGSDPVGATVRTLRLAPAARKLELVVIAGPGFRDDAALAEAAKLAVEAGHTVDIHRAPPDPGALFVSADAAITAAGGTLGELAFLGCPALAYAIVADQLVPAELQARAGLIASGRPLHELSDDDVKAELERFVTDDAGRAQLRAQALATIDADGPRRIIQQIAS